MRIILIGQAAFAQETLERLVKTDEVVAVYCPLDPPSGRFDPVKQKAVDLNIPVRQHKSLKAPQVREEFLALNADLAVLAFVTQIVPEQVFSVPKLGSICFHPSILPKYRGASALNWAIIKGETMTGLSVFWVDPGIDTGPILLQKTVDIDADDTTGSLYFNKIFAAGVDAMVESVALIRSGNAPRVTQDESKASYDPPCRDEHAKIDWSKPAQEVYNLIRGCDPQPGAHTTFNGKMVRIFDTKLATGNVAAAAGEIIAIDAETVKVALNGGTLTAKRMRGDGGKVAAAEFARQTGTKVGDRLN